MSAQKELTHINECPYCRQYFAAYTPNSFPFHNCQYMGPVFGGKFPSFTENNLKDTERMNWMIKHGARVSQVLGPKFQVIAKYGYYKGPLCDSAREAIDKAMEERP